MDGYEQTTRLSCPLNASYFNLLLTVSIILVSGCVIEKTDHDNGMVSYQKELFEEGSRNDHDANAVDSINGLVLLDPTGLFTAQTLDDSSSSLAAGLLEEKQLSLRDAIYTALAHSPEIHVVSYDPKIARREITERSGEFDVTVLGRTDYYGSGEPTGSDLTIGDSDVYLAGWGLRQKTKYGSEWSVLYALTRSWDALNKSSRSFEPLLVFEIRQPLLRDAWKRYNLAGVDIAELNHQIAVQRFHRKADEVTTQTIAAYWGLVHAQKRRDIQARLLVMAKETLTNVEGRSAIDATEVQIQQARVSIRAREVMLSLAQTRITIQALCTR